jgi:hypothetical protein
MRSMRVLLVTLAVGAGSALPVAAQSTEAPAASPTAPAPSGGEMSRAPGMPGIYVTPMPPLRGSVPRDGSSTDSTGDAPSHGGGGCQYVPRKLDLIS